MRGKREINMEDVVGSHELNTVRLSLFNDDGSMLLGGVGKADAVTEVLAECGLEKIITLTEEADSVIVDAMRIVNEMNPKPIMIKNGLDFANEFNKRVVATPLPQLKMSNQKPEWQHGLTINLAYSPLVTKQI